MRQPQREDPGEHLADRGGMLRPAWEQVKAANFPYRYPWRDVERQLQRMAGLAGSPYDGVVLRYANPPVTGGSTMPTLDCWVQLLRPGQQTEAHRHTSSAVYFVVRGEGTTVVDGGVELDWGGPTTASWCPTGAPITSSTGRQKMPCCSRSTTSLH